MLGYQGLSWYNKAMNLNEEISVLNLPAGVREQTQELFERLLA